MAKGNGGGSDVGITVGRISIKVSPDTKKFRSELEAELKRIEKEVRGNINVGVNAQTAKAEKQIDRVVDKKRHAKIVVDTVDGRNWQQKLIDRAQNMRNNMRPDTDNANERARLRGLLDEMKRYGTFKQDLGIDARVLKARWAATLNEIEAMTNAKKIELDVEVNQKKIIKEVSESLKKGEAESAKSPVGGGGGGGGGGLVALGKSGGKFPKAFIPNFGSGINPAGMAVIVAAGLIALAPIVGIVTTALLALPGIIGMMLAPIGAVALALDGIKEAAKVLEEPFNKLRESLSNTAKTQFGPMFESVGKIFPTLEKAIPFVTQGLADMGKSIADFFAQGEGQVMLENTITGIGERLSQMAPGVRDFVAALTGLADEFVNGGALEGVGNWFNDTMADFRAWVAEVSANGELTTAFDNLGKSIKTVLDWLGQMGKTGFNFMAEEGAIDGFNATLEKIGDTIVAVTEFSAKLNQQWQSMVQIGRGLGIFTDLLSGDVGGAWSNAKDLFANKPWQEGAGPEVPAPQVNNSIGGVESLNKALENTQFKSQQAKQSLSELMGTAAPAKVQGPGFNGDYPVGGSLPGKPAEAEKPKVQAPDTTEAVAKLQEYQNKAKETMDAAKSSIESATTATVKPPNLGEFSNAFNDLPKVAGDAMQAVTNSITQGGEAARSAALLVSTNIYNALVSNAALFQTVGLQMMAGLATGIQAGQASAITAAVNAATAALNAAKGALGIKSPSRKFKEVGEYSMEGLGLGLQNGIKPVLNQAKDLAGKISDAFESDTDPTGFLAGFTDKETERMEKVLSYQSRRLGFDAKALDRKAKATGDDSFKAQADAIRAQQDEINNQRESLSLAAEFAELQNPKKDKSSSGNVFLDAINELMTIPNGFASATADQAMQDLNISGDGALQGLAGWGMDFAKKGITNIFNTSNVDDTLALHNNQTNRESQGIVGR